MEDDELPVPPRVAITLREYLRELPHDADVKQEIAGAYYDNAISFDQLRSLVGEREAENFRVLKQQLDSERIINRR